MSPAYSQVGERIKLCVVYVYVVYRLCVHVYARAYVCPVCVHVCTFCVYVCARVCTCVFVYAVHTYACMYVRETVCTLCLHVCARVYACVHVSVYACVCARDCLTSLRGQPR